MVQRVGITFSVGPILLDDVQCTGQENSLSECPHAGIRMHDCVHNEDVGVRCGKTELDS